MPVSTRELPAVLAQHAEEAAFLWLLREAAAARPSYTLGDLADLDLRLHAHLDALVIAPSGVDMAIEAAQSASEPGEVFAAAVPALTKGRADAIDRLLPQDDVEPLWDALCSAFAWIEHCDESPATSLTERHPRLRALRGIARLAAGKPEQEFAAWFTAPDPYVRARAIRALGESKRRERLARALDDLPADDARSRFEAVRAATLLGNRSAARSLRAYVELGTEFASDALQLAARTMALEESRLWLRTLAGHAATRRHALAGCGLVGDPVYVPMLIGRMADPEHARIAGEAFSMITGVDLAYEDLDGEAPQAFEPGPTEDPDDENVEMDADEDLPWPDAVLVQRWWDAHGRAFTPGQRHLCGRPIDEPSCRRVLRDGYQRQRIAAACELALLNADEPLFDCRAPGFRQRQRLGFAHR